MALETETPAAAAQGGNDGDGSTIMTINDQFLKDLETLSESQRRPTVAFDEFEKDLDIPELDLACLENGSEEEKRELVAAMAKAAHDWGFFQVLNHGIPEDLVQKAQAQCRRLFALPLEQKKRAERPIKGFNPGYAAFNEDMKAFLWQESVQFFNAPSSVENIARMFWPGEEHKEFTSVVGEYLKATDKLAKQLVELLTAALGSAPDAVSKLCSTNSILRINHYPPCESSDSHVGLVAHTDPEVLTILLQDDVGGLQVKKDGKYWKAVRPIPNSFVVNVGDLLHAASNDNYISVQHQAVVNPAKDRLSLAYLLTTEWDKPIEPLQGTVDAQHPRIYRSFTSQELFKTVLENPSFEHHLHHFRIAQQDLVAH